MCYYIKMGQAFAGPADVSYLRNAFKKHKSGQNWGQPVGCDGQVRDPFSEVEERSYEQRGPFA